MTETALARQGETADPSDDAIGFGPTEELVALGESARRFLVDRGANSDALWNEFAALGWLGLTLPEAYGGMGPASAEVATIAGELGRHRVTEPWVASIVLAAGLLCEVADPALLAELLPCVADGTVRLALAHEEAGARGVISHVAFNAAPNDEGWQLTGRKVAVMGGETATHLLVTARTHGAVREPGGIALFMLRRDRDAWPLEAVPGLDGAATATLTMDGVTVPAAALLSDDVFGPLGLCWDRGAAAFCAEAVGATERLLEMAVEYTGTRVQFGRALSANQVIRHRLASMAVALEEARSVSARATALLDRPAAERRRAVLAAKVKVGRAARSVAEQAIQLHGGMGVTEELSVGAYLRRILVLDLTLGSAEDSLRQHAAADGGASDLLALSPSETRFRDEVRRFVADRLPPELRRAQDLTAAVYPEPEVSVPWQRALHDQGWAAPAWPAEWGGTGWTKRQRYVFESEMSRAGAPLQHPQGLRLVGPVIMRYGSDAQKRHYLPRILSGEDYWCQGYSEPEAGSDLASLRTRAVRDGDYYVVNGSKMWTTHAHHANRMFALVRTSTEERRQDGISFLLIDMESEGITVRPITTIGGDHEVNQVFLDDVRVPVANRVGEEGAGWGYGKFLLEFERGAAINSGRLRRALRRAGDLAARYHDDDRPLRAAPDIAARLSEIEIDIDALEVMELRVLAASGTGERPGASISSILKLRVSQLHQAIATLALQVAGTDALRWETTRPLYHLNRAPDPEAENVLPVAARYLDTRAYTIFGGTAEIQHDIIARSVIGR